MTSLPMPSGLPPEAALAAGLNPEASREESEQHLLRAFRSFAEAADSLERSYGMLRAEVARLNRELEHSRGKLERSLAENRQMRAHLNRVLDGLPCGVLVAKADGEITLLNPEGRRLLDSLLRAAPGSAASGESEAKQAEAEKTKHDPRLASGLPPAGGLHDWLQRASADSGEQELCFPEAAGGERWLAVRHAAVPDRTTEPNPDSLEKAADAGEESIFILRDVSEAKRLARERDKLRREQALAEMAAMLAHEVRNPLGSLELFAGLLASAALPPECREWVEQVQAGLRTLAATVNNVLHFHTLPAPERAPTDLGQLLDWAGGFLVPMAHQRRVQLCLRNHLHGVRLAADRHRLEQVLLNLVLNALRAMPGGGWVEISGHATARGTAAVIAVSDTGPGLPSADAARIFEPGFSTHPGSPGLGLAVCRQIAEQHGGSLAAANRNGAGASFTLTLPVRAAPQLPARKEGE